MCYNCGCQLPHDPMGKNPVRENGPSLVEEDLQWMAKEQSMSLDDIKSNLYDQLGCNCKKDKKLSPQKTNKPLLSEEKLHQMSHEWGMSVEETKKNICDLLCQTMK